MVFAVVGDESHNGNWLAVEVKKCSLCTWENWTVWVPIIVCIAYHAHVWYVVQSGCYQEKAQGRMQCFVLEHLLEFPVDIKLPFLVGLGESLPEGLVQLSDRL
jgi:hypothetical protein